MRLSALSVSLTVLSIGFGACGDSASNVLDSGGQASPDLADPQQPHDYQTSKSDGGTNPDPSSNDEPYPLVLAHGMSGFQNIGPVDYFYGVRAVLEADGHKVFVSVVDPFNSSDVRGETLRVFVEGVIAQTGAKKVKIIAHSQGGLDARWVANKIPDKVAAIVTISTPHLGVEIADVALDRLPGPIQDAVEVLLNVFGIVLSGDPSQDSKGAIQQVSVEGMAAWNARVPNQPGVDYYSIAGRTGSTLGEESCGVANQPLFVARWNQYKDPINPLLAIPGAILEQLAQPAPTNDGLVSVKAARWGTFLGCIPADHLDEVCQIAGQSPGNGNPFDCHQFYRELAAWMVAEGY